MRFKIIAGFLIVLATFAIESRSQVFNSMSGGYNTGYGTVYGSFGVAAATQSMYNSMQINMQRAIMRQSMIKKWGLARVEQAEREAGGGGGTAASRPTDGLKVEPRPIPKNYGKFRPDATVDSAKTLGDALGETPQEKALIAQIARATKTAFETDASAARMKNNLAGAFTFFIVANSTLFHSAPDPNDEQLSLIFEAVEQTIDEIPEFGKMANREKQALYNTLIGFAGIPLATMQEGMENKSEPTVNAARQLAGHLLKVVLKVEPDRIRLEEGYLKFV